MHSLVRLRNTSSFFFFFLGSAAEDPEEAIVGSLGGSDAREALTLGGVGSLGGSDAKEVPEPKFSCHDNTIHDGRLSRCRRGCHKKNTELTKEVLGFIPLPRFDCDDGTFLPFYEYQCLLQLPRFSREA